MNRRTFGMITAGAVATAAAATAEISRPGINEWILVADGSVNSYGRHYSKRSLKTMASSALGAIVTTNPPEGIDEIGSLLGIVAESKFHNGAVLVNVSWFGGKSPSGFVGPCGVGQVIDGKVKNYAFQKMVVSNYSSFFRATRI